LNHYSPGEGINQEKFEEMAEKCTAGGPVGNLKKLYKNDVLNIYKLAAG
jgi:alcohol dehydrogenase